MSDGVGEWWANGWFVRLGGLSGLVGLVSRWFGKLVGE